MAKAKKTCIVCGAPFERHNKHSRAQWRNTHHCSRRCAGLTRRGDPMLSFSEKVSVGDGCWEWLGAKSAEGYGQLGWGGQHQAPVYAHRFAYQWFVGEIPDGLEIDHLCRNRACVKPSHLEAVTHRENVRRAVAARHMGREW